MRLGCTWKDYVTNYGLSAGEYGHYIGNVLTPSDHGPLLRVNAPVYGNHLVDEKEWSETYPAVRYLRAELHAERFEEQMIQRVHGVPTKVAAYQRDHGLLPNRRRYFEPSGIEDFDIDVPSRPIDPDGYTYYAEIRNKRARLQALISNRRASAREPERSRSRVGR